MLTVKIANRIIGSGHSPYIIAEMSGNHNGDIQRAISLIDAAVDAGADAVKMQTYTADSMTIDSKDPGFVIEGGLWAGRSLYELYREAATPYEWHPLLFDHSRKRGITLFSSPFDSYAVKMLDDLGAPAFKIASFELNDLPLIRYAASFGKPLIMSTGLANLSEIEEAVVAARESGAGGVILLHCVSAYPSDPSESNLRTIKHLAEAFNTPVGLSDHSHGTVVPIVAVAMGAHVIEKHLCLARSDGGVDSAFSLEPAEFRDLVKATKTAFECLGQVTYGSTPGEGNGRDYRRSLYAVKDILPGASFTSDNVKSIRPGLGLQPKHLDLILTCTASRGIRRGEPLNWPLISPPEKNK
jgi:pseudaminic acid synthase